VGRADVYLQPDAADPILDPAVVRALARRHRPDAGDVVEVDETGGEARAYLFDHGIVVKTQRPHRRRQRTSLAKEAALLSHLSAAGLADRIPVLYGYDTAQTDAGAVEYLCMSRIPGRAVVATQPPDSARPQMLADLAGLLRTIHDAGPPPGPAADTIPADTGEGLRRRLQYWFADLSDLPQPGQLPVPLADITSAALTMLPDVLPGVVLLHSNPGPTHTFIDPGLGRLTGIIDFGDAYLSHPAMDLRAWPDPADRQLLHDAYRDGHADDPVFDRVWTVAMLYADAAAIVMGNRYAEAAAADLTHQLRRL